MASAFQKCESFDYEKEGLEIKMCTHPYMTSSTISVRESIAIKVLALHINKWFLLVKCCCEP